WPQAPPGEALAVLAILAALAVGGSVYLQSRDHVLAEGRSSSAPGKWKRISQANKRLQRINQELEQLKESYRDLYHNAPVLYFSLDPQGRIADCNETMLHTLGYSRDDLKEQPYTCLLTPESRERFPQQSNAFHKTGEIEAQWIKKDGSIIDVS